MASRKKRGSSLKTNLKYELYGIIILTLSVVVLSQTGSVPRSFTYLLRFLVGVGDWIVPLVTIYIGLYVMIRREWPKTWSQKKSGLLLFALGFLLENHIRLFQFLDPNREWLSASYILNETWKSMTAGLGDPNGILRNEVGGGMVGALLYASLYTLFDQAGTQMIVYALFLIGALLVFNFSYVEAAGRVRDGLKRLGWRFGLRGRQLWTLFRGKPRQHRGAKPEAAVRPPIADDADDDWLGWEEDWEPPEPKKTRKSPFFPLSLFKSGKPTRPDDAVEADDDEAGAPVFVSGPLNGRADSKESDGLPVIRDFLETSEAGWRDPADGAEDRSGVPWEDDPERSAETADDDAEDVAPFREPLRSVKPGRPEEPLVGLAAERPATIRVQVAPPEAHREGGVTGAAANKPEPLPYELPPLKLLSPPAAGARSGSQADYTAMARKLEETLESFGVRAKVLEVVRGPAVTRFELQPAVGVKVSRIVSLTDDIALALAAKDIRMEAPIPGKSAIGIEVPNNEVSVVTLREVMGSPAFQESPSKLTIALGRDISGQAIVGNLARMPHLLVAGATGSGKSVCINGIIASILFKARPDEVRFLMIDPKMVELNVYNGIPHLLAPVVTDPRRASLALKKIVAEMEKRYELFAKSGTRNIEGYNNWVTGRGEGEPLPFIVVIVDELADLMMVAAGDVEDSICRLAQMARAAGIHLIIATQRPSVDVITGVIKANIPSRIAFGVSSQVDSRTILDMAGAEKLLGRGDMLFLPMGASKPVRVQGAFLSDQEVEAIVTYVKDQSRGQVEYREEMVPEVEEQAESAAEFEDELYDQAVQIVLESKQASVSLLQRRMRIGYTRAARLIDTMEARGIVGPYEGSKPREVLVTLEQWQQSRVSS